MKKDILFLCQFFYPEYNSSATLPFDTAKGLVQHGFSVGAMCGYPKEYTKSKSVPLRETKDGVHIRRLRYIQAGRVSRLGRLINYFSFTLSVLLHLFEIRKYKLVVVYSNPPVLPIMALAAKKLFKTKLVFVAYDIYPEVAYASKSVERGSIIDKTMKKINKGLYKNADCVVALSDEMKAFILRNRQGITDNRVAVIPNWAHEDASPLKEKGYKAFGYNSNQLIVGYIGNMGICQDVETLIAAAKKLKDNDEIQFLIIGHGNKKPYVMQELEGISNAKILDFLTGEEFESAMSILSCGIVSLEKGLMGTCAPSKYYSYLQSGCAIISVTEKESYIALEAEKEKIGCQIALGDCEKLAETLIYLLENRDKCAEMGRRAKRLYEERYSKDRAMKQYSSLFDTLLN